MYEKDNFKVDYWSSKFSMVHNHAVMVGAERVYPNNRNRFTREELRTIRGLVGTFKSTIEIRSHIFKQFGVDMEADDIRRLRSKIRADETPKCDLQAIKDLLSKDGTMEVGFDGDLNMCLLAFTSDRLKAMFAKYGSVLMCDATYECNRGGYHLWHAVVVDCNGKGRSVFYAFISNEIIIIIIIVVYFPD